jgi:hypothetical protein
VTTGNLPSAENRAPCCLGRASLANPGIRDEVYDVQDQAEVARLYHREGLTESASARRSEVSRTASVTLRSRSNRTSML